MKIMALSYIVIGAALLALAIDPTLGGASVTFGYLWTRAACGVLGAPVAFAGMRGLLRKALTPEQALALPEDERRRFETRAKLLSLVGGLILALGLCGQFGWGLVLTDAASFLFSAAGLWVFFASQLAIGGRRVALTAARQKRIAAGLLGWATILAFRDTRWTINEDPKVELDLEIAIEGRAPYRVKHTCVVPRLMIARLVPKGKLSVRVDPEDPNALLVDWNAA